MYEWYVLYCNNQDVERITRRVEGLDVEVFCPHYIKVTPRKDCRAVRQEEKVFFPNDLFLFFDVNITLTSNISSIAWAIGFVSFG
ncbi:hypothetical protein M1717_25840 [Salmonella enterica subsp. enterica serovar Pomona]|uniref:transcription termination/antitermination NusG family protein n=1 Tax=Salmonella enterica TaxID=28901 RepID=UPI0021B482FA|nr:transcription termination/antitermination NusG family protein [Salmonella enterica]MCT7041669.1 hypothetical protein [Salmonella enterica subsp. enterica serovar Pomona]